MQADVPVMSTLYAPATHAVHTADVDAAATLPYAPATHAVHTVALVRDEYWPDAHAVQLEAPVGL